MNETLNALISQLQNVFVWMCFVLYYWLKSRNVQQDFNTTGFFLHIPSYLHEQYLEDFLNLKAERDKVFLGNGLVGGEYTEPVAIV